MEVSLSCDGFSLMLALCVLCLCVLVSRPAACQAPARIAPLIQHYICCLLYILLYVLFPQAKRLAWGNISEMTYFVSSGTQYHNSISQSVPVVNIETSHSVFSQVLEFF